jgi:glucose/arabinose dehydrogenase
VIRDQPELTNFEAPNRLGSRLAETCFRKKREGLSMWRRTGAGPGWAIMAAIASIAAGSALAEQPVLRGQDAFGDWKSDRPGVMRQITVKDLPRPGATPSASNASRIVARPVEATPRVVDGFKVDLFADGFSGPRIMRVAPNGDIFVAETRSGRIRVLRAADGAPKPSTNEVYASGLHQPFGIAFFPSAGEPKWVYVANTDSVVRFAYRSGDLKATAPPETVVAELPHGYGHSTRDVAFSKDDKTMYVSVGSASNVAEGMKATAAESAQLPPGASSGSETDRADVLAFDPDGKNKSVFATGIRNCVGLAIHPATGDLWCSTNERDGLGDNLVPDYVTRVRKGAFYGWPWYYLGGNEDPRHAGERSDLKDKITVPDVLIQPHSASLGLTFYNGGLFPADYKGDGFAAEHGSWNRASRTGYKVIRIRTKDGVPTGEYEDFLTGFVVDNSSVWGRPVGVAVAHDGGLLVSEDGNGTIWRVTPR